MPANDCAVVFASHRSHKRGAPSTGATNTICRPSGDRAKSKGWFVAGVTMSRRVSPSAGAGISRRYRSAGTAIAMLALTIVGAMTAIVLVGFLPLTAVAVWWFVDLFLTPGMVREENARAIRSPSAVGYERGWPAA